MRDTTRVSNVARRVWCGVAIGVGPHFWIECETPVVIDVKPGSFPNSVNPESHGRLPVAILTVDGFDATSVDPGTVRFGASGTEAAPVHAAPADVDADGDTDLILHFATQATGIQCGDSSASLAGRTVAGQVVHGSNSLQTVGCRQR